MDDLEMAVWTGRGRDVVGTMADGVLRDRVHLPLGSIFSQLRGDV